MCLTYSSFYLNVHLLSSRRIEAEQDHCRYQAPVQRKKMIFGLEELVARLV